MNYITQLDTQDAALLFLSCSVNFKLKKTIPGTKLLIDDLVAQSVIFPYLDGSYVIPIFFWLRLSPKSYNQEVYKKWLVVKKVMVSYIPGLDIDDLYIYTQKWFRKILLLAEIGILYEKLIVSSLAVKYFLTKIEENREYLFLTEIYEIDVKAQATGILSKFIVNFSNGIERPVNEKTVNCNLGKAIYHNIQTTNAHHDIILSAKLGDGQKNIAVQCKNSLISPGAATVAKQLIGCEYLLWFYPDCHEDQEKAPKEYRVEGVKHAIKNNYIGFLSGAGCASQLYINLIRVLKRMHRNKLQVNE